MVRALGRPAVVVRFVDGQTAAIPLHWTDRHPALSALQIEGQPVRLHPGSLHELRTLVRELLISQASPAAKLDGASATRTVCAYEDSDARNALSRAADGDPAPVPRRSRHPSASGPGSAPKQGGR